MRRSKFYLIKSGDLHPQLKFKNWRDLTLGIFDLETTGLDVCGDTKIVQFCGVLSRHNKELRKMNVLVNPEIPIPLEASLTHKIYDEHVEDLNTLKGEVEEGYTLAESIHDFLSDADVLVAYNGIPYDLPLLQRELFDAGCGNFTLPLIDPLIFYRHAKSKMSKTKLIDAAMNFSVQGIGGVAHGRDLLHDAEVDVRMLKEVVWAMGATDMPWSLDETLEVQYKLLQKQQSYLCDKYEERSVPLEHYIGPNWQQEYKERNNG